VEALRLADRLFYLEMTEIYVNAKHRPGDVAVMLSIFEPDPFQIHEDSGLSVFALNFGRH
jgi:hypothetical protein